ARSAEDHVRLQRHEFGCIGARSLDASSSPAIFDAKIAVFSPAKLLQPFAEDPQPKLTFGIALAARQQPADPPHAVALPPRRERPRSSRAAEQRDELAALHAIARGGRAGGVGGISRPSIRAVWWLMPSSNLLDCTTGKSAGFAPLRIRPA